MAASFVRAPKFSVAPLQVYNCDSCHVDM